ncbi:DUF971 domain-containing protein [Fuerstiella marisgermanici]|uniref:Gamma-butyrobetaine hydroxylase-like N-terminal domain-containing protein n=1 Tax=Fuerstiella marisgermanici TaxID=1891926 RepID=A0A1P8WRX4_9PLAN|nr:DUF971 domain-containing protein [Fuerstiella marisgermanici]APZ96812.1 hypothetical protein Fuma_06486 [Fuerstiella marisgermanici]
MKTPANIRVHKDDGILELVWADDDVSQIPFRAIRQDCRCAACVDEFTGRQVLDKESVPETIAPEDVSLTGNYALKIRWSDSHDSGLFTWDHLRSIADRLGESASAT